MSGLPVLVLSGKNELGLAPGATIDDALAAVEWLRSNGPGGPLWIAGFSFGAAIAVRAANPARADGLVAIAPAIYTFGCMFTGTVLARIWAESGAKEEGPG